MALDLDPKKIQLIKEEYKAFEDFMYDGKSKEERAELAQFFTPPEISIMLLEQLDDLTGDILDPTSGSGNLLAAALIAGADVSKIYGNEYDAAMVKACRDRIKSIPDRLEPHDKAFADELREKLKQFNDWQIHQGNALHKFALLYFNADYEEMYFRGLKRDADKQKLLDNEDYDAYTMSETFKKKYPKEYAQALKEKEDAAYKKQAEELGGIDWSNV